MSFTFGASSSAGQSNNATTSTAPASGSLFGNTTPASSSKLFGQTGGTTGFSFGNGNTTTPTSGTAGGMFGNKPADQKTSLFGGATTPAAASGSTTPTTTAGGAGGLFGSGAGGSQPASSGGGLFGGAASKPASNLFGNTSSTPTSGGLFGNKNKTPASGGTPTSQASNLFGSKPAVSTGSSLFGSANTSTTPTTETAPTKTPAKPLFAMNSTTPAGAPPIEAGKSAGSLFGAASQQPSPFGAAVSGDKTQNKPAGLFSGIGGGTSQTPTSSTQPNSAPAAISAFGQQPGGQKPASSLFGAKPAESTTTTAAPSLFGSAKPASIQSTTPSTTPATTATSNSLFGATKPADAATPKPASSVFGTPAANTPTTSAATSSSLFGGVKAASSSTPSTTAPPTQGQASSLFGNLNKPAATTANPELPKPASSVFGSATPASSAAPTTTTTTTEAAKPPSSLFGTATPSTTTAASGTATAPASSILGGTKPVETAAKQSTPTAGTGFSSSTTGPTSQMARLKNKTMDEIITRWATDLSKYQKEFKEQAAQVAAWDRLLVENGEKIQQLYLNTYEAEKASREVERHLVSVESQQEELEAWLDKYEQEVDQMLTRDMGRSEQLAGPDQEREKTYKLAEKLTDRLDEMGRDLSKMIKEINDISGSLSKGNKPDDPLSQIVRVLNGHLSQLQWIDTNAAALQAKVNKAQKESAAIGNHYGGPDHDAAESFYRSYMGRSTR